jgi:hypothetical protein
VIHERIGKAALRVYPRDAREARGLEMLGMLLDAGEQSGWAFVRESGSLVLGGLRERRAIAARVGTRRLLADSCCQAVLICLALWIISALSAGATSGPGGPLAVQVVVLTAILTCALIGYERIAAIGGLVAIVAYGPLGPHTQAVLLAVVLVPIGCLVVMVRAPRKRPRDPRRLLWLVPVAVLAVLHAHGSVGLPEILAVMSIGGLLLLLQDPRLAIACGLVWIILLSNHVGRALPAGLSLRELPAVAAGLMLTIAVGRLWIMRDSPAA